MAGLAALAVTLVLPPPAGLSQPGWRTAGVAAFMAAAWITEAAPLSATALVPLVLFPLLGAGTIDEAAAPYANPLVFLFLGGFVLALAVQRCGLHERLAVVVISRVGDSPGRLLGAFMISTAFISLWVSNTATALLMLPIAVSVAERRGGSGGAPPDQRFGAVLVLAVAYASSIGGIGTLVGTPPNALFAGFMRQSYGVEVGFARWLLIGLPLVCLALPLSFLILTRVAPGVARGQMTSRPAMPSRPGPLSRSEIRVAAIGGSVAVLWVVHPLLERYLSGLSDAGVAIAGAAVLFVIPSGTRGERLLDWHWTQQRLPWDVLLLFGGGLSLAAGIERNGLSSWIGSRVTALESWPPVLLVAAVAAMVMLLSEVASNTATAAVLLPIASAASVGIGRDPLFLAIPVTLAASCGFALPVATPPNAIAYATRRVTMREMGAAGLLLDVLMLGLITLAAFTWISAVVGPSR